MPASADAPLAVSRAAAVERRVFTSSMARCKRSAPTSPVGPGVELSGGCSSHRQAGANACPGAAAMPFRRVRAPLFAEVTIDEVGERRDRGLRLRAIGANRDRRSLADTQCQDIENALGVSNRAVLDNLDPRVLEPCGCLHEKRSRPCMKADLVHDRQLTLRYRLHRLLSAVVCNPGLIRSSSLPGFHAAPKEAVEFKRPEEEAADGPSAAPPAPPPARCRWIDEPPGGGLRPGTGRRGHPQRRGTAASAGLT